MWDGLLMLMLLSFIMASASFLAGSLPLSFSLSQRHLRLITALGAGVLVGTSLIVVIPEGIETLYSASGSAHSHGERSVATILGQRSFMVHPTVHETAFTLRRRDELSEGSEAGVPSDIAQGFRTGPDDGFRAAEQAADEDLSSDYGHDEHSSLLPSENKEIPQGADHNNSESHEESRDPHAYVGISLILGFVLMYLIDTVPQHASTSSQPQRFQINLDRFSFNRSSSVSHEAQDTAMEDGLSHSHASSRPSSTTVGLVIHAAADGIALGASSTSTSNLSFVIFIALMIHKAPAAFGLTSVLLKQGLSKRAARTHLIVFSLAAPLGALLTWAAAHLFGYGSLSGGTSTEFATGVLLLFSGGTFLYVAMHTMQEGGQGHEETHTNGYSEVPMGVYEAPVPKEAAGSGMTDTLVCVVGMLLPLLTQMGHAH